ncbi:hypothetical protein PHLCEN_2v8363 [Hermanssonia centrifuga]|uniref:Uncharacterized protein n=1 Tax=Hermanssonia centrifuga TaxID=98765 RepID=A0A2R6NTY6_9APHY|nr:hypothetical protein PHLCEN_2v8363 [Hermanssonia centrifuga]
MEELYADLERQRRIRINVALIAARDREASNAHRIAAAHQDMPIKDPNAPSFHVEKVPEPSQTVELQAMPATEPTGSPIQQQERTPPPVNDEPQPWTPRTLQRGS